MNELELSLILTSDILILLITHIAREEGKDDGEVGDDPGHHQDDVCSCSAELHEAVYSTKKIIQCIF